MPPKKKSSSSSVFSGLTFCVSGDFVRSQSELKNLLIEQGGSIAATPSKACQYLIADSIGSSKTMKAQKDGLPIVTEAWVDASIKAGKPETAAKYFLSGAAGGGSASAKKGKKAAAAEEEDEEEEEKPKSKKKAAVKKAAPAKKSKKAAAAEEEEGEDEEMEEEAPKKKATKAKSTKKRKTTEEPEEEEEEAAVEQPTKKTKAASKKKSSTAAVAPAADDEEEDAPVAPVATASKPSGGSTGGHKPDRELPGRDSYTIVDDYAVLLNQTNITGGRNNNKFYVIQLLRSANGTHYCWTRWGRVGEPGQNKLDNCGSFESALKAFEQKFKDKTKNKWSERANFVKHSDKYELVETEESGDGEDDSAPLGRLSKSQIEKGQAVLEELRKVLESGQKSGNKVGELSARYYTLIPTVVGRQVAPAISTLDALTEKEELLKFFLRMGFDDVTADEPGLSPIDGIVDLPLPKSLKEAAANITTIYDIQSADNRAVDLHKNNAGKPTKKMEPHMYAAILLYTSNAIYAALNAALREEKRQKVKKYFNYLRLLVESLGNLSAIQTTLWRGLSVDVSKQYAVGSEMTWWNVSSCTSDESVARNFMNSCGGKTTLLSIKAKTACDISSITFYPHEKEALLAPGTRVKVLSNKTNGNVTEITVEEIGQAFARE